MRRVAPERLEVYRGGPGLWAFLLHRITGLVLVAWVVMFTVEQSTLLLGADSHDRFRDVLTTVPFRLVELAVVVAALYHALNGLRLVAVDLWPAATARHRQLLQAQVAVFFAAAVPAAWIMLVRLFDA